MTDKNKEAINFYDDPEYVSLIKRTAEKHGMSISEYVKIGLRSYTDIENKQIPDWLYGGEVSKSELHRFAISLNKSDIDHEWKSRMVKTIYSNFTEHKKYLDSFTNPESIFHVPFFEEVLGNREKYAEMHKDVESLNKELNEKHEEILYMTGELGKLENHEMELERSINRLERDKKEIEDFNKRVTSTETIDKVREFLNTVKKVISSIEDYNHKYVFKNDIWADPSMERTKYAELLALIKKSEELDSLFKPNLAIEGDTE